MNYRDRQFKPRFVMWYEEDFRADSYVQRMTPHQRAMYRNLLMECYYGEDRPYLTTDDEQLWLIAGADSLSDWTTNKALIMAKFKPVADSSGTLLYNKRVLAEWDILVEKLAQKRNAGHASAEARRKRIPLEAETADTGDDLLEKMAKAYPSEEGFMNLAGKQKVLDLSKVHGAQVERVWRYWLNTKELEGLKFPLTVFVEEFSIARAAMEKEESYYAQMRHRLAENTSDASRIAPG